MEDNGDQSPKEPIDLKLGVKNAREKRIKGQERMPADRSLDRFTVVARQQADERAKQAAQAKILSFQTKPESK